MSEIVDNDCKKAKICTDREIPNLAKDAVLVKSSKLPDETPIVKGYEWNNGIDFDALLSSYKLSGFQSTHFGLAVDEINKMLALRKEKLSEDEQDNLETDDFIRRREKCTIFLGYTSNMVSSGVRESIRFLVEHKLVDCIVTTAGGVEEDLIKVLGPTFLGEFSLDGKTLRDAGVNRIGNLLVPNDNYCKFETWITPHLDKMVEMQKTEDIIWSPSKIISFLGKQIGDPSSICYWAHKNKIPIFCPALTDGSLGDMMYFHSYKNPGLVVDILQDLRKINSMAVKSINSGIIILGGGVIKHHICNANLMRNGADFAVYINSASEFDGSDSGAQPDEAVSWGKIKKTSSPVKVHAEASLVFPLIIGQTFAKYHFGNII